MCSPFFPEVFAYDCSPSWSSLSLSRSATSMLSWNVAGGSGSRSKRTKSGFSLLSERDRGMWISSAARFASQINVSKSLTRM